MPFLLPLAEKTSSFWMPPAATAEAVGVDQTFKVIEWINYLYGVPIFAIVLLFVWKYRRREGIEPDPSPHHSFLLEITWTVIPTIMIVGIFFMGFVQYVGMTTMPGDPYEIQVNAKKWVWDFTYPEGFSSPELHVPAGRDVLLTMRSTDVMHSLFIPAFRVKRDVIPGRYTQLWFNALPPDQAGVPEKYPLFCTEYCGKDHSAMGGAEMVVVHDPSCFEKWVEEAKNIGGKLPPDEYGELLYKSKGCVSCHSIDGKRGTGPTWKNIYGEEHVMKNGEKVLVEDNYIEESILYPQAKIVEGYGGVMPSYAGQLKELEIRGLIEYMKRLSDDDYVKLPAPDDAAAAEAGEGGESGEAGSDSGELNGSGDAGEPVDGTADDEGIGC